MAVQHRPLFAISVLSSLLGFACVGSIPDDDTASADGSAASGDDANPGADSNPLMPDASPSLIDGSSTPTPDANSGNCTAPESFSFFVMSLEAIVDMSGSSEGFGGDLGGLSGADAKCQAAAEAVGSCKTWHAFLSVTDGGGGSPVHAIDRIGTGPWYDINGLLLAENIAGLLHTRPDGDTDIVYNDGWQNWPFNQCLTTELGNCNLSYGDSHDTLTGSDRDGELYSSDKRYTCNDWTSTTVNVQLPIGHSWPRHLNGTDDGEANWIYAHSCDGCSANINLQNTMEPGVGGDGG